MWQKLFILFVLLSISSPMLAQSGDGIPDNCEYSTTADIRSVFARYEPQHRHLVLVDWRTGDDIRILASDIDWARNITWSIDCRYLSAAVGPDTHMDTIVWDAASGAQIGSVPGAQYKPHPVTWGPGDFLVVETRKGAILWNVPASTQTPLTESFNTTTMRNFSRLRWDASNNQLIANLAVGGRVVYDLATGREVPRAAVQTESRPGGRSSPQVTLGGRTYPCMNSFSYGYRNWFTGSGILDVYLEYDHVQNRVFLSLNDIYGPDEPLVMLEDNVEAASVQFRDWSATCRYLVASLGIPGKDASDTVVWDVVEARRIGTIPDARLIIHPVSSSPYDDALLIQTRHGAILWNLESNTQYKITDAVEIALSGQSAVRNVRAAAWSSEHLHIIPLSDPHQIVNYSITDGSMTSRYRVDFEVLSLGMEQQTGQLRLNTSILMNPADGTLVKQPQFQTHQSLQAVAPADAIPGVSGYDNIRRSAYWYYTSARTCAGKIAQYDTASRSVLIEDMASENIQILEAGVNETSYFGWSPNCTYLSARQKWNGNVNVGYDNAPLDDIYRDNFSYDMVVWNADTGTRIATLPHPHRHENPSRIVWSPAADRALIRTTEGYFVLNPATGETTLLVYQRHEYARLTSINTHFQTYWDFERGQIIISAWGGALVFDLHSGYERAFLSAQPCRYGGCHFHIIEDQAQIVVIGAYGPGVYNLNTLTGSQVDFDRLSGIIDRLTAISPDQRYFVARNFGYHIWDLTTLPEDLNERDPIRMISGPSGRMQFLDNVTLEVTTSAGDIFRWNVESGERTP